VGSSLWYPGQCRGARYIATEYYLEYLTPERLAKKLEDIPLKRLGTPDEIGEVVAFLAGPGSSYIVGEVLTVNGGIHIA